MSGCLNSRASSCSFVQLNSLTLIWLIYMAVITQLLSAAGGSKYWLSPSKAFVFSHKGLMSHFFLFFSLQTCICLSLYQSLVWTSGQMFSHGEAVSKYNVNEKYPWNDLLPTAWHNLSLKPDGMCFTQGALAEEFVKKTPTTVDVCWPCGILWALWRVEPAFPLCSDYLFWLLEFSVCIIILLNFCSVLYRGADNSG